MRSNECIIAARVSLGYIQRERRVVVKSSMCFPFFFPCFNVFGCSLTGSLLRLLLSGGSSEVATPLKSWFTCCFHRRRCESETWKHYEILGIALILLLSQPKMRKRDSKL